MKIIGAGLAGLLAANMLRYRNPTIIEQQSDLPNNHSAVLRFRSHIVGDVLNIPFKKVTLVKSYLPWKNPVADALAYSFKNSGTYRSDRSIIAGTVVADRWIAPPDLIAKMAERASIKLGQRLEQFGEGTDEPWISTMPMPALMKLLEYPKRNLVNFGYASGVNIKARIVGCDAYASILVPDPAFPFARISVTRDELAIEIPFGPLDGAYGSIIASVAELLGIAQERFVDIKVHNSRYAKIVPIDEMERTAFQHWATDNFNIFSLGRFATWRPGLLLDDLVNDVRKIDRWITQGKYAIAKER